MEEKKVLHLYLGLFKNANFYRLQYYTTQAVMYRTMYYLMIYFFILIFPNFLNYVAAVRYKFRFPDEKQKEKSPLL